MPIYEYLCDDCQTRYERLVFSKDQSVTCPKCASQRHTLQFSVFRTTGKSSGSPNGSSFSGSACGCTPKTCGCN